MKRIIIRLTTGILLLSACNSNTEKKSFLNERASVPDPLQSLTAHQKFVTSAMNKKSGTMSVLYAGHDILTLLTWKKRSDENWFGANIPDSLLTVEVLKSEKLGNGQLESYICFDGNGKSLKPDTCREQQRVGYIRGLKPSFIP